ncbi:MAG TPA: LURP-one-related family protein [Dermatophilaceae bacterium]|nr:LURP-one-related family protein [Dermatophilaceae bacterium]
MKSRFGAGRDFAVLDPATEEQRYYVDGKVGPRPRAEVRDASEATVYEVKGSVLGFPKHMTISDAAGAEVASLRAKMFSPIKTRMTMELTSGEPWQLEGSFLEKDYSVTAAGAPIVQITQKWVTVRDAYTLDVADGVDPGLALAVLWAVDRWVERD